MTGWFAVIDLATGALMGYLYPHASELRRALLANGFRVERRG
jgi:hypothetical protein